MATPLFGLYYYFFLYLPTNVTILNVSILINVWLVHRVSLAYMHEYYHLNCYYTFPHCIPIYLVMRSPQLNKWIPFFFYIQHNYVWSYFNGNVLLFSSCWFSYAHNGLANNFPQFPHKINIIWKNNLFHLMWLQEWQLSNSN